MKTKKPETLDFESQLAELTTLVEEMEKGDLKLGDALQKFERGIALSRLCQQSLHLAEQTVKILTEKQATPTTYPETDDRADD